jgi:hypothetical protein
MARSPNMAEFVRACVVSAAEYCHFGRNRLGQNHPAQRAFWFIPEDERIVTIEDAAELKLQQDHVVRLETKAANIEGKNAVHPRPGAELAAHAPRPDCRRRVPRRRGAGYAAGDEHRPRWFADHPARQYPARCTLAPGNDVHDGWHGSAHPRAARADCLGRST